MLFWFFLNSTLRNKYKIEIFLLIFLPYKKIILHHDSPNYIWTLYISSEKFKQE